MLGKHILGRSMELKFNRTLCLEEAVVTATCSMLFVSLLIRALTPVLRFCTLLCLFSFSCLSWEVGLYAWPWLQFPCRNFPVRCVVVEAVLLAGLLQVSVFVGGLCCPDCSNLPCLSSITLSVITLSVLDLSCWICGIQTIYGLSERRFHCVFIVSNCKKKSDLSAELAQTFKSGQTTIIILLQY